MGWHGLDDVAFLDFLFECFNVLFISCFANVGLVGLVWGDPWLVGQWDRG